MVYSSLGWFGIRLFVCFRGGEGRGGVNSSLCLLRLFGIRPFVCLEWFGFRLFVRVVW